jgi:tRNA G18 (ribose-2'-O)-methylase SpoU
MKYDSGKDTDHRRMERITDIYSDKISAYSQLNENRLKHIYEPEEGLFIAESPNVILRAMDTGYVPESFLIEDALLEKAESITDRYPEATVYTASGEVLSRLTGYPMTRGFLSAMKRRENTDYRSLLKDSRHVAVLVGIENPTNMGAIFRSAAALGIDAVLVSHDSCDPLYRRAIRVSMGTVFQVPWAVIPAQDWTDVLFTAMKDGGYTTFAAALTDDAVPLDRVSEIRKQKAAVFFGSEGEGLDREVTDRCDCRIVIPMEHGVDSLNVAAASAVIFWEMRSALR